MCDDNCQNLKPDKIRCDPCRTINLARAAEYPTVYSSGKTCTAPNPCLPISEMPMNPACIKVCTKEEYWRRVRGIKPQKPPLPHIGHGKMMYLVKAGILAGTLYWTLQQGVWGDQQDVTETVRRWQEYIRSINTRRPPAFDRCGNVIVKDQDSIISPLYALYKGLITTVFSGIVKFPVVVKCMYAGYLKELELKQLEGATARQLRKANPIKN